MQVKYKKHKRANNSNGKSSSNPSTPGPIQPPSSTSMIDPFRRPRSESSGGGGFSSLDNKYIISTSPITSLPSMTTLPPVQVTSAAPMEMYTNPNKGLLGGVNILRAALTGSNDVRYCFLFSSSSFLIPYSCYMQTNVSLKVGGFPIEIKTKIRYLIKVE